MQSLVMFYNVCHSSSNLDTFTGSKMGVEILNVYIKSKVCEYLGYPKMIKYIQTFP